MEDKRNDNIDFESIQRMFAERDIKNDARIDKQTSESEKNNQKLQYRIVDLRSEPKYERMHAKNINVTPKSKKHTNNGKLVLAVGVAFAIAIGGIAYGMSHSNDRPVDEPGIVYIDETQEEAEVINPADCDLSNFAVIVRRSTPNVGQIVDTATRELTEMGVDGRSITSSQDLIGAIDEIKSSSPDKQIIVINVDGEANGESHSTVVMTNYDNKAKSADTLAVAIQQANEDIYGISSDIRCGKKTPDGNRSMTSVESQLKEEGHDDVICLTVAPSENYINSEITSNNIATSIAESVIRFASLSEKERYADLVKRGEYGDSVSSLAADNGVSESYIRTANRDVLAEYNGLIRYNVAYIVAPIPKNLTAEATVANSAITTNPNDISTTVGYYTVQPGDTITGIADELNIALDELVIPSGDANRINVGDKIGYETTNGPILVSKVSENKK